ncbi:MAG: outer membrane protein transport protein [Candidatus Brocadiaceae bacterium]|nr:outer membrane protein transport protein [Candidatus Brocadiaceae bacterium]
MNKSSLRNVIATCIVLFFVFYATKNVLSSGFAIFTHGASALGQANSVIAHTDNPNTIFFNPALMNELEETQIELGTTILFLSREFESDATGRSFDTGNDIFYPSTFFITHAFNNKVSAGVGFFNSFGLETKWEDDWEGRYITTDTELQTFTINPVVSYKILPNVAFAIGVDFLQLDATLESRMNFSGFGLPDAKREFEGDGYGVGYNAGVYYDVNKHFSVGASYRSKIKVDIDGDTDFNLPRGTPSPLRTLFPSTDGKADITLPQQVYTGICYKGFESFTLEGGLRWEGWSSYDELRIDFDKSIAGSKASVTDKDWKGTYTLNIGTKYRLNDSVSLLAGYMYGGNPVPDNTFDPIVADSNIHIFTFGSSIKYQRLKFDITYAYQKLEGRNKNNAIDDDVSDGFLNAATSANGEYDSDLHMIGFSLTYKF